MKHAWLLALAICLLLPAQADARKRCRSSEASAAPVAAGDEETSTLHWARGNDSSWVHDADPMWLHARPGEAEAATRSVAWDPKASTGWVHENEYGWWAGAPDARLNEIDEDGAGEESDEAFDEDEQDCTVSKDRNECVVLANQVATYRFRLGLAIEREDELWAESLEATIDRLEARAERRGCTWVEPSIQEKITQTVEAVARAVGVAAQVAAMFYRMGLL